jgi:hypothetical protein
LHSDPRVDPPDGRHTLVPKGGGEGADAELQYVDVAQDLDPSPGGPKANRASKASPGSLTPSFKIMQLCFLRLCIYVSGVELKPYMHDP